MIETPPIPFEPRRFRTTAEYYVRGRLPYPAELIEQVVSITGLTHEHGVLDLGCGPGFPAVAFAKHARKVIGIDPEPAMVEAAATYARQEQVKVTFQLGSSYELSRIDEIFRLITMGRSFHWMDRTATLEGLDRIVSPGGAIALFADSHLKVPENIWRDSFQAVLDPYSEKDPTHVRSRRREGTWLPHESFLLESKFDRLERHSVIRRIETPVQRLVDRALSMSTTSPEKLGLHLDSMTGKLLEVLNNYATNGIIVEVVEFEALIAFRLEP